MKNKAEWLRLPSTKSDFEPIKFRILSKDSIDVLWKHQGKGQKRNDGSVKGCELYLPEMGKQYDPPIDKSVAYEKHPLLFTTCCADPDPVGTEHVPDECEWCSQFVYKGIKTLRRRKYVSGYLVDEANNLFIINVGKGELSNTFQNVLRKLSLDQWFTIEKGQTKSGKPCLHAKKSKEKIKNLNELNEELMEKYDLTNDDIEKTMSMFRRHYPGKNT